MLLTAALLLQAAAAPAPVAPWTPRERTDATTGAKSVTASVNARDGSGRLVLRCDANVPIVSVQFISKTPLGASPDRVVEASFDGGAPMAFAWEFPGSPAFVRDNATVVALTTELAKAKAITVKTTTVANVPVTATFDGPSSDAPVKAVLGACGYVLGQMPVEKPKEPATR